MAAWWKGGLHGLLFLLVTDTALAQDVPPECEHDDTSLACVVAIEVVRATSAYVEAITAADAPSGRFLSPMMYVPRLAAAGGEVADALRASAGLQADDASDLLSRRLIYGDMYRSLGSMAADPLPVLPMSVLDGISRRDAEQAGPWGLLLMARLHAASGGDDRARALFRAAADSLYDPDERPSGGYHHQDLRPLVLWAAAGYADDALAFISGWPEMDRAYSTLAVIEGIAMTGDVGATTAAAASLRGALHIVAGLAVAEAERRAGEPEAALARLKGVSAMLETESRWLAYEYRTRIAQGYALLGDFDAMREAVGNTGRDGWAYHSFWPQVAPFVACSDLGLAIELVTRPVPDFDDLGLPDAWDMVDILVAAARTGQGEEAYAVARSAYRDVDRTLLLMAVLTGLLQARDAAPDQAPCATMVALP